MVSKNNRNLYQKKYEDNKQRWTLRKYSFGVASVMIGITFGMMNITESAHADV
ncbi:YSIRK-type signal peptide-containing protein, partial [Limosilactobacillus equigenerosi]